MRSRNGGPARWTALAIVILALAAPFLGGSTSLWAIAAIALATGILFIIRPPHRSLGPTFNVIFGMLALLPLIQFLPAKIFPAPAWRTALTNLGAYLPSTLSPQPWLTLEWSCVLWLGL